MEKEITIKVEYKEEEEALRENMEKARQSQAPEIIDPAEANLCDSCA